MNLIELLLYVLSFVIAGTPIIVLYAFFHKELKRIKRENGFTNMDRVLTGHKR